MIKELAHKLATSAGIKLSSIEIEDGRPLDCTDVHMLSMKSKGMAVSTKISNDDVAVKSLSKVSELTKEKIRNAIERLQVMLEA